MAVIHHQHDLLHNFNLYRYCWCMCPRCWLPYPGGKGRCVCNDCPCEKNMALLSRVPAPRSQHKLDSRLSPSQSYLVPG